MADFVVLGLMSRPTWILGFFESCSHPLPIVKAHNGGRLVGSAAKHRVSRRHKSLGWLLAYFICRSLQFPNEEPQMTSFYLKWVTQGRSCNWERTRWKTRILLRNWKKHRTGRNTLWNNGRAGFILGTRKEQYKKNLFFPFYSSFQHFSAVLSIFLPRFFKQFLPRSFFIVLCPLSSYPVSSKILSSFTPEFLRN